MRGRGRVLLLLGSLVLAGCATTQPEEAPSPSPVAPSPPPTPTPSPTPPAVPPEVEAAFEVANASASRMAEAFSEDPASVHRLALAAQADYREAAVALAAAQAGMSDLDVRAARANLTLEASMVEAFDGMATWYVETLDFSERLTAAKTSAEVQRVAADGAHVVALGDAMVALFRKVQVQAHELFESDPEVMAYIGASEEDLASVDEMVAVVVEGTDVVRVEVEKLDALLEEAYHPTIPLEVGALEEAARAEIDRRLSPELVAFFDSFDANGDRHVDVSEGRAFYYWVEQNIEYRYDDEGATDAMPWEPVGDGRAGDDYQQTPVETFEERLGDCEDMNLLEVAFYNHFGVAAAQAYVNAEDPDAVDHAIAIVRTAGNATEFADLLGSLDSYDFEADNRWGIPAGTYMIVDNAYSNDFGSISGGIPADRFRIFDMEGLLQLVPA